MHTSCDVETTTILDLDSENLATPKGIGQLVNLKHLDLRSNKLEELTHEVLQLVNMQQLWLGNNNLTMLPIEIGNPHGLILLDLRGNNMTLIGDGIATMGKTELRQIFGVAFYLTRYNSCNSGLESCRFLGVTRTTWMITAAVVRMQGLVGVYLLHENTRLKMMYQLTQQV